MEEIYHYLDTDKIKFKIETKSLKNYQFALTDAFSILYDLVGIMASGRNLV